MSALRETLGVEPVKFRETPGDSRGNPELSFPEGLKVQRLDGWLLKQKLGNRSSQGEEKVQTTKLRNECR